MRGAWHHACDRFIHLNGFGYGGYAGHVAAGIGEHSVLFEGRALSAHRGQITSACYVSLTPTSTHALPHTHRWEFTQAYCRAMVDMGWHNFEKIKINSTE